MRIITLLFVASCVMATSVQAQVGKTVVVSHGHNSFASQGQYADPSTGGNVYGCCEDDVSHCFDLWSTYCSERKPRGACHLGGRCRMATCGCNEHQGIFRNKPCCGPRFGLGHHALCDACTEPGCASGSDQLEESEKDGASTSETQSEPTVDSAQYRRNYPTGPHVAVGQPSTTQKTASRNSRWALPYKWNK
ncbi:MAG: hypothetical protein GY768_06765 [Planctomycetaceae bacterium]|nr:hypothetical protein [Planctomycetaceae bacterium]